ncbi:hypothetical protein D039_3598A, partial [Vibrio parahaemolyticus EKP-028]
MRIEAP